MARRVSLIHVRSSPSNLGSFIFFSLLPEFAIKRMAEQLCCGRVIYKYSYCSKLKILYFPMMPLLSQTNFPDKHETAPVASPLDKRTPWKIMKSGGEGMRFSLGRCVCVWIAFNAAFRLRDFRWWLCCHGGCFSHWLFPMARIAFFSTSLS